MQRISGSTGLADAVDAALAGRGASDRARLLLAFDFDRTLTNGGSSPGETDLSRLVRGGAATVAALRRAHEAGAQMCIVTARRPARATVEQIFASLDHAQSALSPFFRRGPPEELVVGDDDVPLARGGRVYAADYQKAAALAHIVREQRERGMEWMRVLFFDDSVVNAYEVGAACASRHLGESRAAVSELAAFWWDSYEEEAGPSPSMSLSPFGTTDSNYADFASHMLAAYGVSAAEREERIEVYRSKGAGACGEAVRGSAVETELARLRTASRVSQSRARTNGLAAALGARFARGPMPLPCASSDVGGDGSGGSPDTESEAGDS